ncbi:MAG: TIGR03936 family radical SAM-associated protein, partial [Nitrospirota bacterium]
ARKHSKRFVNINVGISPFVPKAHTPFQWYGQRPFDELRKKKGYVRERLNRKGFHAKGHDVDMSLLEAAFSRGDANLSLLVEKAWSLGCRLDGWSETFDFARWREAMEKTGVDAAAYAQRTFERIENLPWDAIDTGVRKDYLWKEYEKALAAEITSNCRKLCRNCGLECPAGNAKSGKSEFGETRDRFVSDFPELPASQLSRFRPVRIRVEFSKTGVMRYLSHLELVAVFHRAMRRAGVPLEYTQGFHPAPKMSFGPPLGVGIAGASEYFDMEVLPPFDLVRNRTTLNSILPEGISIKDMAAVPAGTESLNSFVSRYEYLVKSEDTAPVHAFMAQEELLAIREKADVNVRSMVEEARILDKDTVRLVLIDQGNIKVRLSEILPLIFDMPLEELDVTRTALYGWNGSWVKPLTSNKLYMVASARNE